MTARHLAVPGLMGVAMGVMTLWMLHGVLTGEGVGPGLAFFFAHAAVIAAAGLLAAAGLHRKVPALARMLQHRPSARHMGAMVCAAFVTALTLHLIHGGPTWT